LQIFEYARLGVLCFQPSAKQVDAGQIDDFVSRPTDALMRISAQNWSSLGLMTTNKAIKPNASSGNNWTLVSGVAPGEEGRVLNEEAVGRLASW
jgi:hypothetical protein